MYMYIKVLAKQTTLITLYDGVRKFSVINCNFLLYTYIITLICQKNGQNSLKTTFCNNLFFY